MQTLRVIDPLYGAVAITEPVLIDLIQSRPVQRLKGINQHGPLEYSQPELGRISRYDHSVGVMLLLRRYGASVAEQAAGLLHDVAHTAFSHVVDYALNHDHEQNFHETVTQRIVHESKIPDILRTHGFDPVEITTPENFSLLEQDEPELCADRLDYVLRDSLIAFDLLDAKQVANHLASLQAHDGMWVFADQNSARQFALDMLRCAEDGWYTPTNMAAFHTLGEAMKRGLEKKLISQDDLFVTDHELYERLRQSGDQIILNHLEQLGRLDAHFDEQQFSIRRFPRVRVADPNFGATDSRQRLSEVDATFRDRLAQHTQWLRNGLPLRYNS